MEMRIIKQFYPGTRTIELGDIDNQTPPKAADPSDISYRTGRENNLSSSIRYNNQICPISAYDFSPKISVITMRIMVRFTQSEDTNR